MTRGMTLAYFGLLAFVMFSFACLGVMVGETGGSITNLPGPWEILFGEGYVPHDHTKD